MTVRKFMITVVGENPVGIDEVFEALENVITDYFSVSQSENNELRTARARMEETTN